VHAQSLRTSLGDSPTEAARPLSVVFVTLLALIVLMRDGRMALATALLAGVALFVGAIVALRAGLHVGIVAPLVTAFFASLACHWTNRKPLF